MTRTVRFVAFSFVCVVLGSMSQSLVAFNLLDSRWPAGVINMEMQLGSASGLMDGSASWDDCATRSLAEWNTVLGPTGRSFSAEMGSTRTPVSGDGFNNVFYSATIFGTPFGEGVLAVTASFAFPREGVDETSESDVLFNLTVTFQCYRGARLPGVTDLRRVATHEFGHVLGLGHPDDIGQAIVAIMNAFISDVDVLQTDDIQGVLTLYGIAVTGIPFPPRDQVLAFFLDLENDYRDILSRPQTNQGFVDAEGSAVWFPEWLRYVLNGCSSSEAATRVLLQIRGLGIQPVCGVVGTGVISFPPRDQSLDFLNTLDTFYRVDLNRTVVLSYIDLEGKAVWLQEYLRYRVNGCDAAAALSRVRQQINGGGIAAVCA